MIQSTENKKTTMLYKITNPIVQKQFEITKSFLKKLIQKETSNFLMPSQKYKREEFIFMFDGNDLTSNVQWEKILNEKQKITIIDVEQGNPFDNEILNLNKGIFSTKRTNKIKNQKNIEKIIDNTNEIFAFIRNKKFSKDNDGNRYIYLGSIKNRKLIKNVDDEKGLFEYDFEQSISQIQFEELLWTKEH